MEAVAKRHLTERINYRLLFFAIAILLVIGYPIYVYFDTKITGGIKELGNGVKQVNLKSMSSFVFDQTNGKLQDIPQQWRALDGQRVVLEGEMVPPSMSARGGAGKFELVYSVQKCCFSGVPQIQHFVQCEIPDGQEVPYYDYQVRVAGTLHVKVTHDQETGKINGVYFVTVDKIEPVQ